MVQYSKQSKMDIVKLVLCIAATFGACLLKAHCAEILLVFPLPLKSHYYTLLPIINALADKGHHITTYSTLQFGPHPNITEHLFEYNLPKALAKKDMTKMGTSVTLMMEIHDMGYQSALSFVKTKEFNELMKSTRKYDALITVNIIQEYLAVLQHKFNATNIEIIPHSNSPGICYLHGIPFNPSYYVDVKLPYTDRMNFMERLHNTYNYLATLFTTYFIIIRMSKFADQHIRYPNWEYRPSLDRLMTNKSLILVNGHHVLNYPYPLPPHVIDIAGISIRPNHPLTKNIEDFMNSWPNGVIVLSWGSAVTGSMADSPETDKILLSAFAALKYGVLWKANNNKFAIPVPPNVMVLKWLPQQDVLAHKNIKVFLTHGGFNSVVEATYYGVPLIVTPFFMDQGKNARKFVEINMGVQLLPNNLTTQSLIWAINEVATNRRYKDAAMKISAMFRDRPMTPAQEAVYWIEYVIKHGDVLRPASTEMPFYQLLLLDIIAFSIFITLSIYYIIKKIVLLSYQTSIIQIDKKTL